ncbi:unnamed protein product [Prunus armeniaca]
MGSNDVANVVGQGAMQVRRRCSPMALVISDADTTVGHPGELGVAVTALRRLIKSDICTISLIQCSTYNVIKKLN